MTTEERIARIETTLPNLATKEDLANLRADMEKALGSIRESMGEMKADLIKWMVGTMTAAVVAASTIAVMAVRLFGA